MMTTMYAVYGLLLIGGGVMGYAKAKSQASLISGLLTGLMALAGAASYGAHITTVVFLEAALATVVAVIFIARYAKTKKAMPAIPMIAISAIVVLVSIAPMTGRH